MARGGALLTNDRKLFERALYYHDMGCTFRGHAGAMTEEPFLGNTLRMNEIQCAVLRVQFDRLDGIIARLRERRNWLLEAVRADGDTVAVSPSADPAGDAGNVATFLFKTAEERIKVAARASELNPAFALGSPIDSGLHVYTNWSVLLNKQGGFCDAMNPFKRPENQACRMTITPDSFTKTLDILARSGVIGINISWTREQCADVAETLCQAVREVRS